MFGSNGGGEVKQLTKARLFAVLMIAALIAMVVAGGHGIPTGLNDGGYW